jgi:hypothetical protein
MTPINGEQTVMRSRIRERAGLWAVTACAAAAVLAPADSWAAVQPAPAPAAVAATSCRGVTLATFPAQGFITDSSGGAAPGRARASAPSWKMSNTTSRSPRRGG